MQFGTDDISLGLDLLMNNKKRNADSASSVSFGGSQHDKSEVIDVHIDNDNYSSSEGHGHQRDRDGSVASYGQQLNQQQNKFIIDDESDDGVRMNQRESRKSYSSMSSESGYGSKPRVSQEDILNMKREMLYQFDRLEKKGVKIPKKFSLQSSLDEMKAEFERLKKDREVDLSIKFQRKMLVTCVTGIEFLNSKFDPLDIKLDGWSESISDNVNDYDDVFEELYEKYKTKAKIAPELKLMFMVGGSACMFHLTNTLFKSSLPGLDQVMKQNPELMKQFASATMNTMAQNQAPAGGGGPPGGGGLGNLFGSLFSFGGNSRVPENVKMPQQGFQMKGPSNVDDLLQEINQSQRREDDRVELVSTMSDSDITDIPDDVSIGGVFNKRSKKTSQRRTLNIN